MSEPQPRLMKLSSPKSTVTLASLYFLRCYLRQSQAEDVVLASHTMLFGTSTLLFGFSHLWAADWWVWRVANALKFQNPAPDRRW